MSKFRIFAPVMLALFAAVSPAWAINLDSVRIYFLNGDYKNCINQGEQILAGQRSSKDLDELYYILGISYLKEGNYLRASDIFEIVLKEYSSSKFKQESKLGLGDSFYMRRDFRAARNSYEELLRSDSRTKLKPAIYYRLSQVGKITGDRKMEEDYLDKLKKEFPQSPEALTNKVFLPGEAVLTPAPSVAVPAPARPLPQRAEVIISSGATKPAPSQTPGFSSEIISGGYSVQVGAFSSYDNARALVMKLKNLGYNSYFSEAMSLNRKIYKVRVGGFMDEQEAKTAENKLHARGYPTKIIP